MKNDINYIGLPKKTFKPAESATAENRQAHASEYIAHCLNRIDLHLERIANVLERDDISSTLRVEIAKVAAALNSRR